MPTSDGKQAYIRDKRAGAKMILDGLNILKGGQPEWNYNDYGNTLEDGAGDNLGVTATQVGAAVFATADAIETLLESGHGSNLAALI